MFGGRHVITNTIPPEADGWFRVLSKPRICLIVAILALYFGTIYRTVRLPYSFGPPAPVSDLTDPPNSSTPSHTELISTMAFPPLPRIVTDPTITFTPNETYLLAEAQLSSETPSSPLPQTPYDRLELIDYLFIMLIHLIFFLVGWRFFVWKINHDVQRMFNVAFLFSTTFALSSSMFVLILAEIMNITQTYTRWVNWKLNLTLLLILIELVLPTLFFMEIIPKTVSMYSRGILMVLFYTLFVYFSIWCRNPLTKDKNPQYEEYGVISIENIVSRLSVLGVTTIALLSGFGAINMPHQYLTALMRQIHDSDIILYNKRWNAVLQQILRLKNRVYSLDLHLYYYRSILHQYTMQLKTLTRIHEHELRSNERDFTRGEEDIGPPSQEYTNVDDTDLCSEVDMQGMLTGRPMEKYSGNGTDTDDFSTEVGSLPPDFHDHDAAQIAGAQNIKKYKNHTEKIKQLKIIINKQTDIARYVPYNTNNTHLLKARILWNRNSAPRSSQGPGSVTDNTIISNTAHIQQLSLITPVQDNVVFNALYKSQLNESLPNQPNIRNTIHDTAHNPHNDTLVGNRHHNESHNMKYGILHSQYNIDEIPTVSMSSIQQLQQQNIGDSNTSAHFSPFQNHFIDTPQHLYYMNPTSNKNLVIPQTTLMSPTNMMNSSQHYRHDILQSDKSSRGGNVSFRQQPTLAHRYAGSPQLNPTQFPGSIQMGNPVHLRAGANSQYIVPNAPFFSAHNPGPLPSPVPTPPAYIPMTTSDAGDYDDGTSNGIAGQHTISKNANPYQYLLHHPRPPPEPLPNAAIFANTPPSSSSTNSSTATNIAHPAGNSAGPRLRQGVNPHARPISSEPGFDDEAAYNPVYHQQATAHYLQALSQPQQPAPPTSLYQPQNTADTLHSNLLHHSLPAHPLRFGNNNGRGSTLLDDDDDGDESSRSYSYLLASSTLTKGNMTMGSVDPLHMGNRPTPITVNPQGSTSTQKRRDRHGSARKRSFGGVFSWHIWTILSYPFHCFIMLWSKIHDALISAPCCSTAPQSSWWVWCCNILLCGKAGNMANTRYFTISGGGDDDYESDNDEEYEREFQHQRQLYSQQTIANRTILTPYQQHLLNLQQAIDSQQQRLEDIQKTYKNDQHNTTNENNSSGASSSITQLTTDIQSINRHMNSIITKQHKLTQQLAIQSEIQRRIATDIYQLMFERAHYTKQTNTLLGKIQNISSYFLLVFGVGKILLTMKNLIFGKPQNNIDLPTRVIEFMVFNVFNVQRSTIDVRWWTTYMSFIFLGGLVATQMRGFLINFTKIFRAFALFLSPTAMLYVFTMVMGVYFVSMVLLSRIHLPSDYRRAITHVLGHLQFDFYHHWFDIIFLVAAMTTIAIFYITRKMRPTNDSYDDQFN